MPAPHGWRRGSRASGRICATACVTCFAHPAFTITTAATLLLATVLNTSFFTLFNATVLRTWPVPDAGRVVIVHSRSAERGGTEGVLMSDFEFIQKQARSFAALFAIRGSGSRVWTTPPDDRRVHLLRPVRVRERELLPGPAHPDGNRARLHARRRSAKTGRHRSASSAQACGSGRSAEITACSAAPFTCIGSR